MSTLPPPSPPPVPQPSPPPSPPPILLADCPSGFMASPGSPNCYALTATSVNFTDATDACKSLYPFARVAFIQNQEDNNFVLVNFPSQSWTGLQRDPTVSPCTVAVASMCGNDTSCACAFRWVDSQDGLSVPADFVKFLAGRPNYINGKCVKTTPGGWVDVECSYSFPALCEGKRHESS